MWEDFRGWCNEPIINKNFSKLIWSVKNSTITSKLPCIIDNTMNFLFRKTAVRPDWASRQSFHYKLEHLFLQLRRACLHGDTQKSELEKAGQYHFIWNVVHCRTYWNGWRWPENFRFCGWRKNMLIARRGWASRPISLRRNLYRRVFHSHFWS